MANATDILLNAFTDGDALKALSKTTGAKTSKVQDVLTTALPLLLSGMQDNVKTKQGEAALTRALGDHASGDTTDIAACLMNSDSSDGEKILSHVLGDNSGKVIKAISTKAGTSKEQTKSILSTCAPLLLSLLGQQNQSSSGGISGLLKSLLSNPQLLGSLLGGNNSEGGGLLGSLLGGDSQNDSSDGGLLGGLLGSLLGGDGQNDSSDGDGLFGGLLGSLLGDDSQNDSSGSGNLLGSLLDGGGGSSGLAGTLLDTFMGSESKTSSGAKKSSASTKKKTSATSSGKKKATAATKKKTSVSAKKKTGSAAKKTSSKKKTT